MMKNLFFAFLTVFVSFNFATAQDQGHVKMEVTDVSSEDENIAMQLEMMKGMTTDYFYTGNTYMSQMSIMGGMVNVTTKTNKDTKEFDMLMDAMGQKFWVDSDLNEINRLNPNKASNDDVKIVYDKKDTKTILGLNAYKFTMDVKDMGKGAIKVEGYVTEEIKSVAGVIQGLENIDIAGFPLELTVTNPMLTMKMEAKEYKKEVPAKQFELKTGGYKQMTMKEFMQAAGGMGGFGM